MIVDSRTLPAGKEISTGVCIIGAGAAGITLAREFIGAPFDVTLLEGGGLEIEAQIQDLYAGEIVGRSYHALDVSRLRYFGGTTNHWAGYCRPLDPIDFETRSYVANSGWPFGYDELAPYYRRAQAICEVGKFSYSPDAWQRGSRRAFRLDPTRIASSLFQVGPPARFGRSYGETLRQARNVAALLHANVTEIEVADRRVTGLKVAGFDGGSFTVKAKLFVLAAGAIENARLLLVSNKTHPDGAGNAYGLVGRYFMDHPIVWVAGRLVTSRRWPEAEFYANETPIEGTKVIGCFNIAPELQRREQLLNAGILLDPVNTLANSDAVNSAKHIWQAARKGEMPDRLATHIGHMFDELEDISDLATAAHRKIFRPPPMHFTTRFWCECPPDADSRVMLGDEVDALGLRRVRLDWRLPSDLGRYLERTHEILAEELGRKGIGRVQIGKDGSVEAAIDSVEGSFHQMGTTRMHASPRHGVVDPRCRVHDMANLYIAGASVFPTYGHTNPTLTIIALATRLADHLKRLLAGPLQVKAIDQLSAAPAPAVH